MTARLARYCLCGGAVQVRSTPPTIAEGIAEQFERLHTGDGHGEATAAQAASARRREERRILAEEETR
jgi:hypothetical protein